MSTVIGSKQGLENYIKQNGLILEGEIQEEAFNGEVYTRSYLIVEGKIARVHVEYINTIQMMGRIYRTK